MRHRKSGVKLNRTTSHRQAMFRNMVTSLLKHDRIRTTDVKAKELRRWADHIITLAKRGDLHARRQVLAIVRERDVVHKLFEEAQSRFGTISGGYTRIVKIGTRPGDSAPISLIELVAADEKEKKSKKKTKKKATKAAPSEAPVTPAPAAEAKSEADAPADEVKTAAPVDEESTDAPVEAAPEAEAEEPAPDAEADDAEAPSEDESKKE